MGWLIKERRRGISWTDRTLSSISAPPMHLLALLAVAILLMSMSSYTEFKVQMEKERIGLKILLFCLPVALLVVANLTGRYWLTSVVRETRRPYGARKQEGSSPWGVALVVVLLLVLVKYHSSFQSAWF